MSDIEGLKKPRIEAKAVVLTQQDELLEHVNKVLRAVVRGYG